MLELVSEFSLRLRKKVMISRFPEVELAEEKKKRRKEDFFFYVGGK